jgi:hypothetical protein
MPGRIAGRTDEHHGPNRCSGALGTSGRVGLEMQGRPVVSPLPPAKR